MSSGNVSWLKKSEIMKKRTIYESNSSMTLQNPKSDKLPAKRKSCLIGPNLKDFIDKSARKSNLPCKTEFRNRTLKMLEGKGSTAAAPSRPSLLVRRSTLIGRKPLPLIGHQAGRSTPLHKSTPNDPPRSILKARMGRLHSAKRVNFDSPPQDEGVSPLQESIIQMPIPAELPPVQRPLEKVNVAVNTDPIENEKPNNSDELSEKLQAILKPFIEKMEANLELKFNAIMEKMNNMPCSCSCKNGTRNNLLFRDSSFIPHLLDDIREVSENSTPTMQEENENTPSTEINDNLTPKSGGMTDGAIAESAEACSESENNENVPPVLLSPVVLVEAYDPEAIGNKGIATHSQSPKGKSRSSQVAGSPLQTESIANRLRNFRKRKAPLYLQSFELSPRPKAK